MKGFADLGSALNAWQSQNAASLNSSQEMLLSVDVNVLVSMSVGISQDLSKVPALWYFLTSFITSPGKLFAVVRVVL